MRLISLASLFLMTAAAFCTTFVSRSTPLQVPSVSSGTITIDQSSVTSLRLKILHDATEIGSATGFVVEKNSKRYLVTNRHVVRTCAQDQNPSNVGGWICANKISIFHNRFNHFGEWFWVAESLFDDHDNKRWLEHPTLGGAVDLVALPLQQTNDVQFYPLDMELRKTDIAVGLADAVSIVGFPFGLSAEGGLPVWKTGSVASDPDVNIGGKPIFLVDTTSRPGMSGSPVYAVRSGAYHTSKGELRGVTGGTIKKFLGVYSEQFAAAELGGVWKPEALMTLYDSLS